MLVPFCDLSRSHDPIRRDIDKAIAGCIDRSTYLRGPETRAFESEWATYCGQAHAVCCSSGTDALAIAVRGLGLQSATIPANTLPLTGIGLHAGGASVSLSDITDSGWIEPGHEDAVPVLLHGMLPPSGAAPAALYDAAHAHGWKPGSVTTDDPALAHELEILCGRDDRLRRSDQMTSRIDEVQAAVLRVKLRHLDRWLEERREIAAAYVVALSGLPLTLPSMSLNHLFAIGTDHRDDLQAFLSAHGVETKTHWSTPLNLLNGPWRKSSAPRASAWCSRTLSLPCFPGLRADEIDRTCDLIAQWVVVSSDA